jgi:phosphoglycolate phosphatase
MKKYDTILFDLDGTLLDTIEDITDSVNYVLALYNFPSRSIAEIRRFVGGSAAHLIELSIPDGLNNPQFEKCLAAFRQHYLRNMQNKTGVYKGIPQLLGQLAKLNYKMAIVSNKFDNAAKELTEVYFGDYIKVALGESENISKKPAPDIVFKALEALGSIADKTIYVGDTEVDVKTAKNAGVVIIGVTWGFRDREVLEQEEADYIIDSPQELLKILSANSDIFR